MPNPSGPNKQVTLNRFFNFPPSIKPISTQARVDGLFEKQNRKTEASTSKPQESKDTELEIEIISSPTKLKKRSLSSSLQDENVDESHKASSSKAKASHSLKSDSKSKKMKAASEDQQVTSENPSDPVLPESALRSDPDSHSPLSPTRMDAAPDTTSKTASGTECDKKYRQAIMLSDEEVEMKPVPAVSSGKPKAGAKSLATKESKTQSSVTASDSKLSPTDRKHVTALHNVDQKTNDEVIEEDEEDDEDEDEDEDDGDHLADLVADDNKSLENGVNWEKGTPIPYASLVHTFTLIDATTKRLEITKYLSQYLMQVITRTPNELIKIIYLCINRLCPDYEGIELGIGESILIKAIGSSMGRTPAQVKADFKKTGDLGLVARNSRSTQKTMFKPKLLTVNNVYQDLKTIATTSGHSSQAKKVGIITKMLAACQGEEAKYIIRSLEGKLRIGLAERTVLVALATAVVSTGVGTSVSAKHLQRRDKADLAADIVEGTNIVKAVYSEIPSYDLVIPALLKGGVKGLRENCKLTPGVPLKPMLAKPTKSISEVLDRFEGQEFTCEYKYDGERAQIHYLPDGSISIFSRNSENMSVKYPDMLDQLPRAIKKDKTQSFVLDAEAVAWDAIEKKILPFQELSKRKRKDVKSEDITIKVQIFAFDLLYLNGRPLIKTDLKHRRELLRAHFEEVEGEFSFAKSVDVNNVEEIQVFLDESVKAGCEGLMVKMMNGENANYEPSRRSMNWLKVKKDYLAGVGDSLDLVVVGAYFGRGKRTNVYGAFLLACYDNESETYQTICKLGTGFSEEVLESHHQKLKPLELTVKKKYFDVGESKPDVWLEPKVVWEVLAADLSLSPVYSAARGSCGDGTRGVSLRFPRYIRERDDKGPEDATGPEQVAEMYQRQVTTQNEGPSRKKRGQAAGGMEDDFW